MTNFSIVAVQNFVQATRDSGYKGTASAVSELVDNSLQSGADHISVNVTIEAGDKHPVTLAVIDNGYMNGETIRIDGALRMPPK